MSRLFFTSSLCSFPSKSSSRPQWSHLCLVNLPFLMLIYFLLCLLVRLALCFPSTIISLCIPCVCLCFWIWNLLVPLLDLVAYILDWHLVLTLACHHPNHRLMLLYCVCILGPIWFLLFLAHTHTRQLPHLDAIHRGCQQCHSGSNSTCYTLTRQPTISRSSFKHNRVQAHGVFCVCTNGQKCISHLSLTTKLINGI